MGQINSHVHEVDHSESDRGHMSERYQNLQIQHKREMKELKEAQGFELLRAEERYEQIIREAGKNNARLEREKRRIEEMRLEEQQRHIKQMNELNREHRERLEKMRDEEKKLTVQQHEERKYQLEKENQQISELFEHYKVEFKKEQERDATIIILKEILQIRNTSQSMKEKLQLIDIFCSQGSPDSLEIKLVLQEVIELHEKLRQQSTRFVQSAMNQPNANQRVVKYCENAIANITRTMEHEKFISLPGLLASALRLNDPRKIKECGKNAGSFALSFSSIEEKSKKMLENKTVKELTAPSTQDVIFDSVIECVFQTHTLILIIVVAWIYCCLI